MKDEQKILRDLKKKRRDSLEKVIKIYNPYVRVVVYNIIGSVMTNEDIEEVISDVFISLWRNIENLDAEKGSIRTYLGTIARNTAKNKLRNLKFYIEIDDSIPFDGVSPQESFEVKEEKDLLLQLIMSLGEPDSEIFIRYYHYEQKIKNIACYMGLPISTVKTKLSRGRLKLKEIYEQRRDGHE